jgi:glutathione S-transferase
VPGTATLIGVPASHPTLAAELMLQRKGVDYRRVDLVAGVHRPLLRGLGFPGITVPAVRFADGVRIQGSRNLSRALDALYPERPLFPADRREEVERAEHWGDLVLQEVPRRLAWWGLRRRPEAVDTLLVDAKLGMPLWLVSPLTGPVVVLARRLNHATDKAIERDLAALPGLLDQVDRLIADGVIGADEPNAADFQIATSIRLLMTFADLRPGMEERPVGEFAVRVVPRFPGNIPPVLP